MCEKIFWGWLDDLRRGAEKVNDDRQKFEEG